jgi:hypothetical protein
MGHVVHNAILVTCWNHDRVRDIRRKAKYLGFKVSDLVESNVNGYISIFLCSPDGSKTGWKEDLEGNQRRDAFVTYLRKTWGSQDVRWVEIQYGDEDPSQNDFVVRSSQIDRKVVPASEV